MSSKTKEIEEQISEQTKNLCELQRELQLQQIIDQLPVHEVQNNFLEDVRLVDTTRLTAGNSYVLMFRINGREFKEVFTISDLQLISGEVGKIMTEKIYMMIQNEIFKNCTDMLKNKGFNGRIRP